MLQSNGCPATVKDLTWSNLTWKAHIEERLMKGNIVFYLLRRNVAMGVKMRIKLGLYKSLILIVLIHGFVCITASRTELKQLESFQKRAVKWITELHDVDYENQLRLLNLLPLPMFLQLKNLLLLSKIMNDYSHCIELPATALGRGRKSDILMLNKKRTEKARGEFVF